MKKKMPNISLSGLNKEEMAKQEQNALKGGTVCDCGFVHINPDWSVFRQEYENPVYPPDPTY